MAYDFSKKKVSVKDLSKKRKDAVAASRKSSSSSSSKIDTSDVTPDNILSDSWQKDVVTLEEAKQQTREAGSYLQAQQEEYRESQGIVQTVDTQKAGISESWNKDTVTLAEAQAQTGQAQEYINAKTDQTNEAIEANNAAQEQAQAAPQPLPAQVDPDSELGRAAIASGQYYAVRDEGHPTTIDSIRQMQAHPDRTDRMAALLGVRAAASGTGSEGTDVRRGPLYVKTVTEGKSIKEQMNGLFREGVDGANGEITEPSSVQFAKGNYATTYGIYQKAETVANKANAMAGKVIDATMELTPIEKAYDFMLPGNIGADTVKSVNKGAVEGITGAIPLIAGIPLAGEVAIREPEKVGSAVVLGAGLIAGSMAQQAKEDPARLAGNLLGSAILAKGAGSAVKSVRIGKAQVVKQTGSGAKPSYETVDYGGQLSIADNPVISISKESGIKIGKGAAAPLETLDPNTPITAFSKLQTANFTETLAKHGADAEYFKAGHNIAKSVNRTPTPVKEPTAFEITSKNIPDSVKPIVKDTIQNYKGDVEVYGSVAQKAQAMEYMTRSPADLEVSVGSTDKFTAQMAADLGKRGVPFEIKGVHKGSPKIMFKEGKALHKGIEIFSESDDSMGGYHPSNEVAYNMKSYDPLKVEGVRLMDLREQGGRKLAGGLTLQKKATGKASVEPIHAGRLKDVSDLLEIGVGHAVEKKPGISKDVLKFNKMARAKYPEHMKSSPLSEFMAREGRIPKKNEMGKLFSTKKDTRARELLFRKVKDPMEITDKGSSPKIRSAAKKGSVGIGSVSARARKGKGSSTSPETITFAPGPKAYPFPSVAPKKGTKAPGIPYPATKGTGKKGKDAPYPVNYPGNEPDSQSPWLPGSSGSNGITAPILPGSAKRRGKKAPIMPLSMEFEVPKVKGDHAFKVGGKVKDNKWRNPMSIDFSKSLKPTTRTTKKTTRKTKTGKRR